MRKFTLIIILIASLAVAKEIVCQANSSDLLSMNVEALSRNEQDGFKYREKIYHGIEDDSGNGSYEFTLNCWGVGSLQCE